MANEDVVFRRGPSSSLPSQRVPGTILIETDTGNAYVDDSTTNRVQLTDTRKLSIDGSTPMTGTLRMGNNKITNLGTPTQDTDASTKAYVDTAFTTLESELGQSLATYLPLKGGTMTGPIDAGGSRLLNIGSPQSDTDATTKGYVDSLIDNITSFTIDSNGGSGYASLGALQSEHPTGTPGVFYLVVNSDASAPNAFDEYFWTGTAYEKAGGFGEVNTSDLATKEELAGYLPLTGGTLTGRLLINSSDTGEARLTVSDGSNSTYLYQDSSIFSLRSLDSGVSANIQFPAGITLNVNKNQDITLHFDSTDGDGNSVTFTKESSGMRLSFGGVSVGDSALKIDVNDITFYAYQHTDGIQVHGVATPTADTDAANKAYVDKAISGAGGGDFLANGSIPMTGNLNLDDHRIINVSDPTADTDAATKSYVDDHIITYTSGTGIDISGTVISHDDIGTAGSVGPDTSSTLTFGGTFIVPYITVNAQGHVSTKASRTLTMPSAPSSVPTLTTARTIDGVSFNGSSNIIHYGACSSLGSAVSKTVTCSGFTKTTGAKIIVKFNYRNTATNPTLNVNSTTASPIYYKGSNISSDVIEANGVYEFVYTGSAYEFVGKVPDSITLEAGTGIQISGSTISHANYGTADTTGPTSNRTLTFGGTFVVPYFTTNAQGHVTAAGERTFTMPATPSDTDVTQTNTTTSADYRVLLSYSANDISATNTVRKSGKLTFNPSTGVLTANQVEAIIDDGIVS